ncbi:short chain dehydrogenase [Pseudomonas aeruginosa]|nr:short chain dehydrogenase [Pseudomonas aeruginosa]
MRALAEAGFQAVQLDVNDAAALARLAEELEVEAAGLDVLVNNAGYGAMGPLLDGGVDAMRRQFETNVFAVVGVTRALFPLLRRKSGLVVNVGSVSGVLVTPFAGAYCASKAAVHALSDALRLELAPFGVEVLEVQPGAIASNFGASASREMDSVVDERSPWWPLRRQIQARAAASQDNPTPAEDFARQLLAAVQRRPRRAGAHRQWQPGPAGAGPLDAARPAGAAAEEALRPRHAPLKPPGDTAMGDRLAVPIRYYALAGIAAAILLNVLLRGVVRFGGLPASLLIAALVAGGLAWWFARAQRRWPTWGERLRLVACMAECSGPLPATGRPRLAERRSQPGGTAHRGAALPVLSGAIAGVLLRQGLWILPALTGELPQRILHILFSSA